MYKQVTTRKSVSYEELFDLAVQRIKTVVRRPQLVKFDEFFAHLRQMLESLPLSTGEFSLALNRLNSSRRYLAYGETGAACYELKQLMGGLERMREATVD